MLLMMVQIPSNARIYGATAYGADPTGKIDSTEALLRAISDAFQAPSDKVLMEGIIDLGGAEVYLEGGSYLISHPLQLPATGGGNLLVSPRTVVIFFMFLIYLFSDELIQFDNLLNFIQ